MTTHPRRWLPARGQVVLIALVFFGIFVSVTAALVSLLTVSERAQRVTIASAQALALAEAGIDQAAYQLNQDPNYAGETDTTLPTGTFTVTVTNIDSTNKRIVAVGRVPSSQNPIATKTLTTTMSLDSSVISFRYGIQAGDGGFSLANSSQIIGNAFSTGPVIGGGGNYIRGEVISAGASGLVYGIHATSSVYAHTIGKTGETTIIDKDAYYVTKINTTVTGTSHPDSPDQGGVALPISDEQIGEWETLAAAGGTATCEGGSYNISSGSVTIGPVKIPCDLNISGSATVTIGGHVWVVGNIIVQNSAIVKMAASLGAQNVAIIADNPSDRLTGSTIQVKNTASFQDSGTSGSFVFLISQNNSAENGGDIEAFELSNSASALVAYAAHGLIPIANSVSLKEVTAYKITLKNSATITYDTGLPNTVFQSGPGASWAFVPGTYAISP
ncbi:MAG: hypothetical protein Q8P36_00390 [bacterium]|nr:hypothetical protein [bacterium]